jgi:endonuclease/exonuclease/phosphatase (EEP) superfamily protein YafD
MTLSLMQIMEINMKNKQELLAQIAELQAEVERLPDDQQTGRVLDSITNQDPVFIACIDGGASRLTITSRYVDCVKQGRVFHTEKSALNFARYEQLVQKMRVVAAKYEPCDWDSETQKQYNLTYSSYIDEWREDFALGNKTVGIIHCSKSGALLEWVKSLSASDQEILKRGEL